MERSIRDLYCEVWGRDGVSQVPNSIFSIFLLVSCLFFFFFCKSNKTREGTKELFRVIASEKADVRKAYFSLYTFSNCL